MLTIDWFRGKHVLVMGLGLHGGGVGSATWLMRHGAKVTVTDLKDEAGLAPSVAKLEKAFAAEKRRRGSDAHPFRYVLGRHDEADFRRAHLVIQGPGVPRDNRFLAVAREAGVRIETDMGIFFQLCPFPSLGVTGTRGKTTTTLMLAEILRRHDKRTFVAGNLRVSVLSVLDPILAMAKRRLVAPPPVLLELSSWHLEGIAPHRLAPHVSVVTNLFEDHLNRYAGMADYAMAKAGIVAFQRAGDVAVLNLDNPWTRAMGEEPDARTDARPASALRWFSSKKLPSKRDGACLEGSALVLVESGKRTRVLSARELRVPGAHNVTNALAAVTAARAWGVPVRTIAAGLKAFKGAPSRQELIATLGGVRWINDTTATSPDGAIMALRTFGDAKKKRVVLIAGGVDKSLHFDEWAKEAKKYVRHLVLFDAPSTTATPRMRDALDRAKAGMPIEAAGGMAEAVRLASAAAKRGDVVLLSPGCASFGLFVHEFDRGERFVYEVKKLARRGKKK